MIKSLLHLLLAFVVLSFFAIGCKSESNVPSSNAKSVKLNVSQTESDKKEKDIKHYIELAKQYDAKKGKNNEIEAFKCWTKAAELGDAEAQYIVGLDYLVGVGVQQDLKAAHSWFLKSALQGNKNAQYRVGSMFEEVLMNNDEAFKWYYKASQQGHRDAQFNLAHCYAKGKGVKKDVNQAFIWYKKSAEQGEPFAMMALANCYYEGLGVSKDKNKAIELYKQVVALNDADASDLAKTELEIIVQENK